MKIDKRQKLTFNVKTYLSVTQWIQPHDNNNEKCKWQYALAIAVHLIIRPRVDCLNSTLGQIHMIK